MARRTVSTGRGEAEKVTIRQIASAAEVSVGTVSNVLNKRDNVTEETRNRVMAVVAQYDYRPSAIARGLSTRHTRTLGLIISLNPAPFYTDLAQGAFEAAREGGVGLSVVVTDYDVADLSQRVDELTDQWVDGIFLATQPVPDEVLGQLPIGDTPLVVMDRGQTPNKSIGLVGFDWHGGAYAATRHLLDLGHVQIGYVGGIADRSSSVLREQGYLQAMKDAGFPPCPDLMRDGDFTTETGYRRALELLTMEHRPTALFMANDLMALGAYQAIHEVGLRVPDDLSVVGVDDVFFVSFLTPPLTTIRIPTKEAGRAGIRALIEASEQKCPIRRITLPTELIIRSSTSVNRNA